MTKQQELNDTLTKASKLYEGIIKDNTISQQGYVGRYFIVNGNMLFKCNKVTNATDKIIDMEGFMVSQKTFDINIKYELHVIRNVTPIFEIDYKQGKNDFEQALELCIKKLKEKL